MENFVFGKLIIWVVWDIFVKNILRYTFKKKN